MFFFLHFSSNWISKKKKKIMKFKKWNKMGVVHKTEWILCFSTEEIWKYFCMSTVCVRCAYFLFLPFAFVRAPSKSLSSKHYTCTALDQMCAFNIYSIRWRYRLIDVDSIQHNAKKKKRWIFPFLNILRNGRTHSFFVSCLCVVHNELVDFVFIVVADKWNVESADWFWYTKRPKPHKKKKQIDGAAKCACVCVWHRAIAVESEETYSRLKSLLHCFAAT